MSQRFIINSNGTVSDPTTGLMWQRETAGLMSWKEAIAYCEGLSLDGHDDWRLPSINELLSLVDYTTYNPAIDTDAFPDTVSSYYWSSTTYAYYTGLAVCLYFYYGDGYGGNKSNGRYVRAVRGGQSGSFGDLAIPAKLDDIAESIMEISAKLIRSMESREGGKP